MSRIDDLIQELCPAGVERKPIWSVTFWDKNFHEVDSYKQPQVEKYPYVLAAELKSLAVDGANEVRLLATSENYIKWTTKELAGESISEGEIIAIPWGGTAQVQYFNGFFVTADNRIATSRDINVLSNKFLYYLMLNELELIGTYYRGSGIKHPSMKKVLDINIPVPPLEVQREIVSILDKFTELEAELEAELRLVLSNIST